jgi:hypothetical protein
MENASKALIMAGGILVGILVISLAVYLFADFSRTAADINSQNEQQRIVEFNSKFTTYDTYKDKDGNWQITIYDIISLAGYAKENNDYYSESPDEQISVNIQSSPKTNNVQTHLNEYTKLISNYAYTANGSLRKFSCESIEYNSNGKVKEINFKTIN